MVRIYHLLITLLFIYAIGHAAYTFWEHPHFNETQMWFLSGALGLLFNALLNLLHLKFQHLIIKAFALISNIILFTFSFFLCAVIPEIQVFVLTFILLSISITSVVFKTGREEIR